MKCAIFLATGFEECEALITVDLLRRVGITIDMISISDELEVESSHQILIQANKKLKDIQFADYDVMILPGGTLGAENLGKCEILKNNLLKHYQYGKLTCAICAAPSVLGKLGILEGKTYTCFPGFDSQAFGGTYTGNLVEHQGNLITGKAMFATIEFAREIIREIASEEVLKKMDTSIQYQG